MKNLNKNQILDTVKEDVKQRIKDWISAGGSLEDEYVDRQVKYLDRVMNTLN